ncbi:major facilitator superfamily domain-containing protein [Xylogone sp. PMI_703]|nr:major facilitator superfamily domain-containing protein [Xylogone sp. PMI_703]
MATQAATRSRNQPIISKNRTVAIIAQLSSLSFLSSFCSGVIVIALPAMQSALDLKEGLLVWPTSSYHLTAGSCLLMSGSITDVVGAKGANIIGSFLSAICISACGLARSGGEIIAFRALQGVAYAIVTPSSVSIISNSVEKGRLRNMGFAFIGFGQPLGFCFGLVLGRILTDAVGWRPALHLAAGANLALFYIGIWALPQDPRPEIDQSILKRLRLGSTGMGLAMFSYVLASLSADINNIHKPSSIVLLIISIFSILSFVGWMHHQVRNNRTVLIPNTLWSSRVFTSICIIVLLNTALTTCMELYSNLFFQRVQGISAVGASVRVLPSLIVGSFINISTGIFVNRMPVFWAVLISSLMTAVAPLLMAVIPTNQTYWKNAFFARFLTPISCDILFTVGLLIISDIFPENMQALSGAIFNTCAQLGNAIGLGVTQLVASLVTDGLYYPDKSSPDALMKGWMVLVCLVCMMGLRRIGDIGVRRS